MSIASIRKAISMMKEGQSLMLGRRSLSFRPTLNDPRFIT